MKNIIVYPKNEQQEILLKSLLKEMNIHFKMEEKNRTLLSEEEFYKKIDKSIQQADSGQTRKLTPEMQKELLDL